MSPTPAARHTASSSGARVSWQVHRASCSTVLQRTRRKMSSSRWTCSEARTSAVGGLSYVTDASRNLAHCNKDLLKTKNYESKYHRHIASVPNLIQERERGKNIMEAPAGGVLQSRSDGKNGIRTVTRQKWLSLFYGYIIPHGIQQTIE